MTPMTPMTSMRPASDHIRDEQIVGRRLRFAGGFIAFLTMILLGRLAYIQIIQHQRFSTLAHENRVKFAPLPPVRGLIYDRNGVLLAGNVGAFNIEILPDQVDDMDQLLGQLGELVKLNKSQINRFKSLLRKRPSFERQTLRTNLNEEEAARVALHQHRFPGVELQGRLQRHYPQGDLVAHVLGYVGRINADDMKKIDQQAYRSLDYIGRSGLESQYESILRGAPGFESVEVNAHGKQVRSIKIDQADAGRNVHLSLDLELQRMSMQALEGREGAVVAMEPESGQVLAFVGAPAFDPNPFVNGISEDEYAALRNSERLPLLNRALYGRYAPGSVIKSFMALVGMENDIDPKRRILCPGWYELPDRDDRLYRDWKPEGHGHMNAFTGIVESCDVYFYDLANQLGIKAIHDGMLTFGFGRQTGVDLPGEPTGLIPSDAWKRRVHGVQWYPGDTVNIGIGQGYMLVTPLQLAAATATLANRGRQVTPQFLHTLENPRTRDRRQPPLPPAREVRLKDDTYYDYVIASMREVVHGSKGTARGISYKIPYEMAGKTGTAQVKSIPQDEEYDSETVEKKHTDNSLFIAFAPIDQPKIAIAVVVEHAGSGSGTAAPIARKLIDFYLLKRLGMSREALASDTGARATSQ